jgi:hypothetical protein
LTTRRLADIDIAAELEYRFSDLAPSRRDDIVCWCLGAG